jgi:hypothetical protein
MCAKITAMEKNKHLHHTQNILPWINLNFIFIVVLVKRPGHEADKPNPVPSFKMSGAMAQLPHIPSLRKQGQLYYFLRG